MLGLLLMLVWGQWHVGPIGMVQTFQTIGKGLRSSEQRLSWGTGTAIGKVFGHGHWGVTAEVLTALVQFGAEHRAGEERVTTRTRLTAVEGVFLTERYWRLSPDWEIFTGAGAVINLPYQVEYFAHRQQNGEDAFLFMQDRRYWEIHPAGARVGQLRSQPYPAVETSFLWSLGLEKHLALHWTLAMEARLEYSFVPTALPVEEGMHPELPGWQLPTRPPHLLAESFQLGLYYFFHPLEHCKERFGGEMGHE